MEGLGLLLPLLLLIPLVLITMRTRRQQREMAEMQQRLAPGQEVMTTSGVFGTVVDVEGDKVLLRVADGVTMRWARPAVARIVTSAAGAREAGPTETQPGA